MVLSPEQWDYRNTWAPMQSYIIEGLYKTGEDSAKKVALELAKIWIKSNYIGLYENEHMFEKVKYSSITFRVSNQISRKTWVEKFSKSSLLIFNSLCSPPK